MSIEKRGIGRPWLTLILVLGYLGYAISVIGQESVSNIVVTKRSEVEATRSSPARHDEAMDIIQRSVVFIYSTDSPGNRNPMATGFLLRLLSKSNKTSFLELLVTARHVVEPNWHSCSDVISTTRLFLRLNVPDYDPSSTKPGVAFEPLELIFQGKKQYFVHSDPTVDLAVVLLTPANSPQFLKYGYQGIPFTALARPDEVKVGMPIFSLSLVPGFPGTQRNYPIFREGSLASIPQEQFPSGVDCEGKLQTVKAWLIASHMGPGSSGGPIFLNTPNLPLLLGVQSFIMQGEEKTSTGVQTLHYDVAGFTPVPYLYDIIRSMNLADADLSIGSHK